MTVEKGLRPTGDLDSVTVSFLSPGSVSEDIEQKNVNRLLLQLKDDQVMMTRESEDKEILSDSSSRDIPEIVNEDFVKKELVTNEIVKEKLENWKVVTANEIRIGSFLREGPLDKETIQRSQHQAEEFVENKELKIEEVILQPLSSHPSRS